MHIGLLTHKIELLGRMNWIFVRLWKSFKL
jgi:hypothetical protein